MTRVLILALATVALLPGAALALREPYREESTLDVRVRGLREVVVENAIGRVELKPSPDAELHLRAIKVVRARDREAARRMASEIRVEAGPEGDHFAIRVRYPARRTIQIDFWELLKGVEVPRSEVRIELEVPATLRVRVSTASGDLYSDGVVGPQSLRSASGDLEVTSARGPLEIVTASGDVTASDLSRTTISSASGDMILRRVRGPLDARSTSGEIEVEGAEDSLTLNSSSGDVRVDRAPRGARVSTTSGDVSVFGAAGVLELGASSGDVEAEIEGPLTRAEVNTSSGEIHVRLAPRVGCRLELRTASGSLDLDAPLTMQTVSRHRVTGVVRGGTAPVELKSASGDITVKGGP